MSAHFNPLTDLDPQARDYAEQLDAIADALVRPGVPKHRFWTEASRAVIAGYIDYLIRDPMPLLNGGFVERTLGGLRDGLTQPNQLPDGPREAVFPLSEMAALGGKARCAAALLDSPSGELVGTILASCIADTRSLDSQAMREALSESDFSLRDLNRRGMTVYVLQLQYPSGHEWLARLLKNLAAVVAKGGDAKHAALVMDGEISAIGRFGVRPAPTGLFGTDRLLRKYRGSILWLNADPETVVATAPGRRARGQTVYILDPMGVLEGVE
jgi:type IV secretory pathway TraG/TraD family ATPase VirD4